MASLRCTLCRKSLIRHILRQEALMKSILDTFIENAHLYEEQMVDKLISEGILQTKTYEILTVPTAREHRARTLWLLLLRFPPGKFKKHVEPLLEQLGFLKNRKSVDPVPDMCLRCVMEHMLPVEELADKLVTQGKLKLVAYRDTVKTNQLESSKWHVIFDSLQCESAAPEVVEIFENLLKEYEIPVPKDMAEILHIGVPCACTTGSDSQDGLSDPPTGPFCRDCEDLTQRCRRQRVPSVEKPPADDDNDDDVEMRPRSCRDLRKKRMAVCQGEVLNSKFEQRKSG